MKQPVELRVAAILAAYVPDYSRLSGPVQEGSFPTDFRRLIDAEIEKHQGRIFFDADFKGMLAEFSNAADAVLCAVEIQCAIAGRNADIPEDSRIAFGLGVSLGDDILAEALAISAKPGGICVSRVVRDEVRGMLDPPVDEWVVDDERKAVLDACLERPIRGTTGPLSRASDPWIAPAPADVRPALLPVTAIDSVRGSILWNPPDRMRVGRHERIEVRIADADVTVDALREGLRGRGIPQIDQLEVTPLMRVVLTADTKDFYIQPLNTQDQFVRRGTVARWDFDVTPFRSGVHRLRLLASMRIKVEGKDEIIDLPSYESEVRVAVAPVRAVGQFCARNWQWISGTVVIPLVAWMASTTGPGSAALKQLRAWLNP
jgi:hypothetical protein